MKEYERIWKINTKKNKLETEYKEIIWRNGDKVELLWNVSANPKYGYPGLFDRKVYKAIEQITTDVLKEKGKMENPIPLGSLYNLCKRMNIENYGGVEYKKIKKGIQRAIKQIEMRFYSITKRASIASLEDAYKSHGRYLEKNK